MHDEEERIMYLICPSEASQNNGTQWLGEVFDDFCNHTSKYELKIEGQCSMCMFWMPNTNHGWWWNCRQTCFSLLDPNNNANNNKAISRRQKNVEIPRQWSLS